MNDMKLVVALVCPTTPNAIAFDNAAHSEKLRMQRSDVVVHIISQHELSIACDHLRKIVVTNYKLQDSSMNNTDIFTQFKYARQDLYETC